MDTKDKQSSDEVKSLDTYMGQKLRSYREKVGWTLSKLAEKVDVSHQQIHKYEQGLSKLSASMLYKLSLIFQTSPTSFFEGFSPEHTKIKDESNDLLSLSTKEEINLLLIEDNPYDEFLVRKVLEKTPHNFNIYVLHDGEMVLSFLRNKLLSTPFSRPDIILLDLNIPKVDGLSLLRSIKQDRDLQEIPIIVLTSSLSKVDMLNAYKNHASGYISKSFELDVFKKKLEATLSYWIEAVVLPQQ
jgi:CheY-like chemotaxis protein/DNA-binding XRE family transcriptional regulator